VRCDLLVEVAPGTPEAIEFARVCRTRSLLIGLGNTAEDLLLVACLSSDHRGD
jgi:hypothetical protein